jgi:hypothetical protein
LQKHFQILSNINPQQQWFYVGFLTSWSGVRFPTEIIKLFKGISMTGITSSVAREHVVWYGMVWYGMVWFNMFPEGEEWKDTPFASFNSRF